MTSESALPPTDALDPTPGSRRIGLWALFILLALLLHGLVFLGRIPWQGVAPPPRVELKQVDPAKLEEIRRRWRETEKQLLIDKNAPKSQQSEEAPDNARYMSDRNIRVEKEQRAKDGGVLPKEGARATPGQNQAQSKAQQQHKPPTTETRKAPQLGTLGVPFRLDETSKNAHAQPPHQAANGQRSDQEKLVQDQLIDDKSVAEGSENLLNAQESVYYSFYARLYEAIGPLWESRINAIGGKREIRGGEYTTAVDVVLSREGRLIAIHFLRTSGIPEFDRAVEDSWKQVGHFPNPPSGLLDANGEIHTGWTFTVHVGQGGLFFAPPERRY